MNESSEIREKAPLILAEIKKASSILVHCHPSPDPDSVGSSLAMKFALGQILEKEGKSATKVTLIRGDSDIPAAFGHFPAAETIVQKSWGDIDLAQYDLFIALDSGSIEMISRKSPVTFPDSMKVIVIDHHRTNTKYGSINLVDPSYPATAQILFDLFKEWGIQITPEIAANLFIGMYTDTGGFKYEGTSSQTFNAVAELVLVFQDFPKLIATMENSSSPEGLAFQGRALSSIETFLGGKLALSGVSNEFISAQVISSDDSGEGMISTIMRRVPSWNIVGAMIEIEPGKTKISFRTKNSDTFDVSKLAVALGGGGHKAAAGAVLALPLEEAKKLVVAKAKELYNL